jgi:hypothetical protein
MNTSCIFPVSEILEYIPYDVHVKREAATSRVVRELWEMISSGRMSWQLLSESAYQLTNFTPDELSRHSDLPLEAVEALMLEHGRMFERVPAKAQRFAEADRVWQLTLKGRDRVKMDIAERSRATSSEVFLDSARAAVQIVEALIEDIAVGAIDKSRQREEARLAHVCIVTARNRLKRAAIANSTRKAAFAKQLHDLDTLEARLSTQRVLFT